MSDADLAYVEILARTQALTNEILGVVRDTIEEENRGRETPDDRDRPEEINDDGLA